MYLVTNVPSNQFLRPPPPSQALAGDLSDRNRAACAETTKPLLEAVEALTTFASSPQFASTPARISEQARKAQAPILEVGVALLYTHTHTNTLTHTHTNTLRLGTM